MLLNRKRLFVERSARAFFPFLETEPFVVDREILNADFN